MTKRSFDPKLLTCPAAKEIVPIYNHWLKLSLDENNMKAARIAVSYLDSILRAERDYTTKDHATQEQIADLAARVDRFITRKVSDL